MSIKCAEGAGNRPIFVMPDLVIPGRSRGIRKAVNPLGEDIGCIEDGDSLMVLLTRGDREQQISYSFAVDILDDAEEEGEEESSTKFEHFALKGFDNLAMATLILYGKELEGIPMAFPASDRPTETTTEVLCKRGYKVLKASGHEKRKHVGKFFNGQRRICPV